MKNIVLILTFENDNIYLVESVYKSDKYPHEIPYDETLDLKSHQMFKVWDLDKATHQLDIESIVK